MNKALLVGVAALLLAGCSQTTTSTVVPEPTTGVTVNEVAPTSDTSTAPWIITLGEQNKSGQQGTATLEEVNGKVVVTIAQTGTKSTVAQPAHIHVGSCPTPGDVKFPLTNVVDGKSVTTIDTTLTALKALEPLAINVHKSAAESKVYTSCGDVK